MAWMISDWPELLLGVWSLVRMAKTKKIAFVRTVQIAPPFEALQSQNLFKGRYLSPLQRPLHRALQDGDTGFYAVTP